MDETEPLTSPTQRYGTTERQSIGSPSRPLLDNLGLPNHRQTCVVSAVLFAALTSLTVSVAVYQPSVCSTLYAALWVTALARPSYVVTQYGGSQADVRRFCAVPIPPRWPSVLAVLTSGLSLLVVAAFQWPAYGDTMRALCGDHLPLCADLLLQRISFTSRADVAYYLLPQALTLLAHGLALRVSHGFRLTGRTQVASVPWPALRLLVVVWCLVVSVARPTVPDTPLLFLAVYHITFWAWQVDPDEKNFRAWCSFGSLWCGALLVANVALNTNVVRDALQHSERHFILHALGVEPMRWEPFDWMHLAYLAALGLLFVLFAVYAQYSVRFSVGLLGDGLGRISSFSLSGLSFQHHPTLRWCYHQSPQLLVGIFALAALVDPCLLSIVWLAMFCLALLLPLRVYTYLLPWLLAYAWVCLGVFFAAAVRFMPYIDDAGGHHDLEHKKGFLHLLGFKRWDPPFPLLLTQASVGLVIAMFNRMLSSLNYDLPIEPEQPVTLGIIGGQPAAEEEEEAQWSWWTRARVYAQSFLLYHAAKVTLVLLFLVGFHKLNLISAVFMIFFIFYFVNAEIARRTWILLVLYTFAVIMALYVFMLLPDQLTPTMKLLGLSGHSKSPWDLVPYMVLYLCAGIQNSLYTIAVPSIPTTDMVLRLRHNVLRGLCLFCYLLIALLNPISIISLAFFLLFLLVTAMIILNLWASVARWMWLFIVLFTTAVVVTIYAYQFEGADALFRLLLGQFELSPETWGLFRYQQLQLSMLPWISALVLAVLTAGVSKEVYSLEAQRHAEARPSALSMSTIATPRVSLGLKAWAILRRALVIHTPKALLVVLFVAATTPFSSYERLTEPDSGQDGGERVVLRATVSSTVYVVLLLLFNASKDPSQVLVFFTLCYSIGVMMAVYLYQFSLFAEIFSHVDDALLAYLGLAKASSPHALASFLLPHIAVFTVGLLQAKTLIWRWRMRLRREPMLIALMGELEGPEDDDASAGPLRKFLVSLWWLVVPALNWLLDSAFQTWGPDVVLFVALLCATRGLPTLWALLEVLFVGAAARWPSLLHGRQLTGVLFVVSLFFFLEFMLYLGLPDFARLPNLPFSPNNETAKAFWGVYYDYLTIQPQLSDLWPTFLLTAAVGLQRRSERLFGQRPPSRQFSDVLVQRQGDIEEARRSRQLGALAEVLPTPEHTSDYMQPPRSLEDWVLYLRFYVAPFALKVWLFWLAANPAEGVFTIFTVAVLICALWTLHIADQITWKGNAIWRAVPRLLWAILMLKAFMYLPPVYHMAKALSYIDIAWLGFGDFSTPGKLVIMLAAVYLQTYSYDSPLYVFVLHFIHRQHCRAHEIVLANRQLCAQRDDEYYAQLQKESEDRRARVKMIAEDRKAREEGKIYHVQPRSRVRGTPALVVRSPSLSSASEVSVPTTATATTPTRATSQAASPSMSFSNGGRPPTGEGEEPVPRRLGTLLGRFYHETCVPHMEWATEWLQRMSVVTSHDEIGNFRSDGDGVVKPLLASMFQFALSYTDWMCYAMLVVKFTVHPSALTMLPPLTIFTYALLVEAPSRSYWSFMLFWFQMLIVVGSLMTMLETTSTALLFCEQYGIYRIAEQDPTYSLLFDLATLLCINVHRNEMLKFRIPAEDVSEATPLLDPTAPRSRSTSPFLAPGQSSVGRTVHTVRGWLDDLRNRRKVGRDFYLRSFVAAMFGFAVLLSSFDSIVGQSQDFVTSVQNNLLPGSLALTLFGYFLSMVLDRVCYLVRSPGLKLGWHFSVVALVFAVAYKYLVIRGQNQWQLQLLLWVTFTWLSYSALQLYWGYPQAMGSSWLMSGYSPSRHLLYIAYRAIPFVYEMKALLDWTCTATTLKMNEWLKLEDIHHELVLARADREDSKVKKPRRGMPFPFRIKCYTGFVMFSVLCLLIFFPLMYYSSFSPALAPNNVNMTQVSIQFPGASAIFEGRFRALQADLPTLAQSDALATALSTTRPALADVLAEKFVQVVSFSDYSLTVWGISPPILQQLLKTLQTEPTEFELQARFTRSRGFGGPDFGVPQTYRLNATVRQRLYDMIQRGNASEIVLPAFYCPFIINNPLSVYLADSSPATGKLMQDCKLVFEHSSAAGYWQLKCRSLFRAGNNPALAVGPERTCVDSGGFRCSNLDYTAAAANRDHKWVPMYYVVMSSEVPKRSGLGTYFQSLSIMAIYSTFVLTAGRVIRLTLTGSAQRVVLEDMKNPEPLVSLVEDIKLARAEGELGLEEELYEELINIYRSPELIKQWTAPP